MSRERTFKEARWTAWTAALITCVSAACASLAGLDGDYELDAEDGDMGTPTSGSSGASTGGGAASSSSSGSGGIGGGGAGGMAGAGGTGGSLVEDCLDGIDNDGDANTDCADSDCVDFICVDKAPIGWEGYFRINTTPYPNNVPSICPDGTAPDTYFDTPGPGDCSACSCGAWQNASCSPPPIACWDQSSSCMGNVMLDLSQLSGDGTCFNVPGIAMSTLRSCALTGSASVTNPGACPPTGGALLFPEAWMNQDDVCGQPIPGGGGCDDTKVCVPMGNGDYTAPPCIRKAGTNACPADYPISIEVATGGTDDRACSACQCTVSGTTCVGGSSYSVYDLDACAGPAETVSSMSCVNVTQQLDNNTGSIKAMPTVPAGGTCTESGGEPSGSVTPEGIVTFCCAPS